MQAVDIRQIADKFPDKRGGLKELYDKGPQPAFFLVKFWVNMLYVFFLQDFLLRNWTTTQVISKHTSDVQYFVCVLAGT